MSITTITTKLAEALSGLGDHPAPVVYTRDGQREYILLEGPGLSKEEDADRPDNFATIYTYTITIHAESAEHAYDGRGSMPTWEERVLDILSVVWPALHNRKIDGWQLFPDNGDWDEREYVISCYIRKPEDLRPCRA